MYQMNTISSVLRFRKMGKIIIYFQFQLSPRRVRAGVQSGWAFAYEREVRASQIPSIRRNPADYCCIPDIYLVKGYMILR